MAPEHGGVPPPPISFVVKVTAKGVRPAFWGHNPPRPEGTVLNTGAQQAAILTLSEPSGSPAVGWRSNQLPNKRLIGIAVTGSVAERLVLLL